MVWCVGVRTCVLFAAGLLHHAGYMRIHRGSNVWYKREIWGMGRRYGTRMLPVNGFGVCVVACLCFLGHGYPPLNYIDISYVCHDFP